MTENEKMLMRSTINEITRLRSSNQAMASRLDVFDKMMILFGTSPNPNSSGMMSPDLVYEIETALRKADIPDSETPSKG